MNSTYTAHRGATVVPADETATAIGGLFADPARRIELARAARELVLSSYT